MTPSRWLIVVGHHGAPLFARILPGDVPRLDVLSATRNAARAWDAPARIWTIDANGERTPWAALPTPSALRKPTP